MDLKELEELQEKLEKTRDGIHDVLSMKDLEVRDSDLIKFNKHGQWSINKEDHPWPQRKGQPKGPAVGVHDEYDRRGQSMAGTPGLSTDERKKIHSDKLKELKDMPNPKLTKEETVKFEKNGQWSLNKEEPYWSTKAKMQNQKRVREMERSPKVNQAPDTRMVKPSTEIKYVNISGKGRGESKKDMDKEQGGGSLSGSYGMIS